jgi:hypothetical protein
MIRRIREDPRFYFTIIKIQHLLRNRNGSYTIQIKRGSDLYANLPLGPK